MCLRRGFLASGFLMVLVSAFPFTCCRLVDAAEASISPVLSQDTAEETQSADKLLDDANAFYEAGDLRQAEEKWLRVRSTARTSPAWPKAVFNLGILEMREANYDKAVTYFNEVLQCRPNDKEPGGNIMEAYRNYSHRSALQISMCYERMGQSRQALYYARLAKTRYPYFSWCGTCLQSANFALNKRIAYLCLRVYGIPVLGFVGLAGLFFIWKGSIST
jgi:tetratricopeptide (TPR) repeat protein